MATSTGVSGNEPPSPPRSPWLERYRYPTNLSVYQYDHRQHSGLAPEYPPLDPVQYDALPAVQPETNHPSYNIKELGGWDRIFVGESDQELLLAGLKTWQIAPFNNLVYFGPKYDICSGGHDSSTDPQILSTIYESEIIKVDESTWFRFFRRDRWYDNKDIGMSPDDESLWKVLRISLELSNRIMMALIDDGHEALQTILYGRVDVWDCVAPGAPYPESRVLLSLRMERQLAALENKPCEYEFIANYSREEWIARLETLMSKQCWGLHQSEEIHGITWKEKIVSMNYSKIQHLRGDYLTIAERCFFHMDFAVTVVHELVHAIFKERYRQDPGMPQFNIPDPEEPGEPHFDFEPEAEIGRAFEQRIFGGIHGPATASVEQIQLLSITDTWPIALPRQPRVWTSLDASRLLSEAFWASDIRKSDDFFHRVPIFTTMPQPGQSLVQSSNPVYKEIENRFVIRNNHWAQVRSHWRADIYDSWRMSPWRNMNMRANIETFAKGFREKDEGACAISAANLASRMEWDISRNNMLYHLPPTTMSTPPSRTPDYTWSSTDWSSCVIGLLMMAATPIRKQESTLTTMEYSVQAKLTPSTHARSSGFTSDIEVSSIMDVPSSLLPSRLFSFLGPFQPATGEKQPPHQITQLEYINIARDILRLLTSRRYMISLPWLWAIQSAMVQLIQDRSHIYERSPFDHDEQWCASWPFVIPAFMPLYGAFDPVARYWREVRPDWDADRWEFVPDDLTVWPLNDVHRTFARYLF